MAHVLGALPCISLGVVSAISFGEVRLTFRAPGITLAPGRLVVQALNGCNLVPVAGISSAIQLDSSRVIGEIVVLAVLWVMRLQVLVLRPLPDRRADNRFRGKPRSPSNHHHSVAPEGTNVVVPVFATFVFLRMTA